MQNCLFVGRGGFAGIMGLFDKLRKKEERAPSTKDVLSEESGLEYTPKYLDVCKYIWTNFVPKNGQAGSLQGELLREIEKLRWEAQENGNINWDEDFSYFCDFISKTLTEQTIFSEGEKEETILIMRRLKEYGAYAEKAHNGEIPYEDVDMNKIAYIEDDLYDIICDKIARLHMQSPQPIPYEKNEEIDR